MKEGSNLECGNDSTMDRSFTASFSEDDSDEISLSDMLISSTVSMVGNGAVSLPVLKERSTIAIAKGCSLHSYCASFILCYHPDTYIFS